MQQKLDHLFSRYLGNIASPAEVDEFYQILDKGDQDQLFEQLVDAEYVSDTENDVGEAAEYYPTGAATRILKNILATGANPSESRKPTRRLWSKLSSAAAAIVIFSIGIWFLKKEGKKIEKYSVLAEMAIPPGKPGATLILASGKKIRLSDASAGKLADEAGIAISKTASGELVYDLTSSSNKLPDQNNTLSTSRGETYQLRLPDGSLVWLNAASSLKYSTKLIKNGLRTVQLTGEGYFQVAKDKNHPFIVETAGQKIEVLGTHFNVNSYNQVIRTTLLEGRVSISTPHHKAILNPGEQSESSFSSEIQVRSVDTYEATAWKEGFFYFNDEDIVTVMKSLAAWYDVEISYQGTPTKEKFSGNISRNLELSKALKLLSHSNDVHFKTEGRRIIVMK